MKKFIIFIMFVFVLIPGIALAGDINLEIKEVKLVEKSENAEVVNNPVIDGLSVKTDIRLNILSDYVKYKIIIKNKGGWKHGSYKIESDSKIKWQI